MSACVFCDKIAAGDVEHDYGPVVRFEPLNPVTPGHRLFVPKKHVADVAASPVIAAQVFARAASYAWGFDDCNLLTSRGAAATQTVFHLHVHFVPRREGDGLALPWTGQQR